MKNEGAGVIAFIVVFGVTIAAAMSFAFGINEGVTRAQASAVEAGVGEYVVIDANGNTEFKWITNEN